MTLPESRMAYLVSFFMWNGRMRYTPIEGDYQGQKHESMMKGSDVMSFTMNICWLQPLIA